MELFSYTFIVRAIAVGVLVALCAALLGVTLVLRRCSMIGDGLSHVGFGTLAVAMSLNLAPLEVSIPVVLLAAFFLLRISENSKIRGDAAIALISGSALAIGVMVVSMTTGMNADVCNYMFGSILAMSKSDVVLSVAVAGFVLILYVLFYNRIFAVTFDENFARATGMKAARYNMLIALLTAMLVVVGMRMMGAMLISSLIIFPALTSMRVFSSFRRVVVCSAALSVVCFFVGIVLSFALSTPAGASIVIVNLAAFCLFLAAEKSGLKAGEKLRDEGEICDEKICPARLRCGPRPDLGRFVADDSDVRGGSENFRDPGEDVHSAVQRHLSQPGRIPGADGEAGGNLRGRSRRGKRRDLSLRDSTRPRLLRQRRSGRVRGPFRRNSPSGPKRLGRGGGNGRAGLRRQSGKRRPEAVSPGGHGKTRR
jgi:zinc transport system permease protein